MPAFLLLTSLPSIAESMAMSVPSNVKNISEPSVVVESVILEPESTVASSNEEVTSSTVISAN